MFLKWEYQNDKAVTRLTRVCVYSCKRQVHFRRCNKKIINALKARAALSKDTAERQPEIAAHVGGSRLGASSSVGQGLEEGLCEADQVCLRHAGTCQRDARRRVVSRHKLGQRACREVGQRALWRYQWPRQTARVRHLVHALHQMHPLGSAATLVRKSEAPVS